MYARRQAALELQANGAPSPFPEALGDYFVWLGAERKEWLMWMFGAAFGLYSVT